MSFLSRSEEILSSKISGDSYSTPAQSRLEKLLLQLNTGTGIDTTVLTQDVETLKQNVSSLDKGMTKNANNIGGLQTSVQAVQNKIMNLGTAMEEVQTEFGVLQKGVEELNTNIRDIQEDVIRIEDRAILDSNDDEDD